MALLIGYGSRLVSREERKDADRSSAQDDLFHAPFELSIRLVAKVYSPRKKSTGYPSKKRKWDWVLHGFAASHEPRRELQEVQNVMTDEQPTPLGVSCIAMEFVAAVRSAL